MNKPIIKSFVITTIDRDLILEMANCKNDASEFYKRYNQLSRKDLNMTLHNFSRFYLEPQHKPKAIKTTLPGLTDHKRRNFSNFDNGCKTVPLGNIPSNQPIKPTAVTSLPPVAKRYQVG